MKLLPKLTSKKMISEYPQWYEHGYRKHVLDWHNVFFLTFGADAVINYLANPLLICQEAEETINAIHDYDTIEVIDGLYDVLWEIIPVIQYLEKSTELAWKYVKAADPTWSPPTRYENVMEALKHAKHFPSYIVYDQLELLFRIRNLEYEILQVLEKSFAPDCLSAIGTDIVESNFSKCVLDSKYPADVMEVLWEEMQQHYGIGITMWAGDSTFKGGKVSYFKNESGKVLKIPSTLRKPNIAVVLDYHGYSTTFDNMKLFIYN